MDHVMSFDSMDEMMEFMQEQNELANARVLPHQRDITYGDHWMRVLEYGGTNLFIFGRVHTREESLEANAADDFPLSEDFTVEDVEAHCRELGYEDEVTQELVMIIDSMDENHSRGFRFSRAYSTIVPEGELGDVHVSEIIPINKKEFEQAESVGFSPEILIGSNWFLARIADFVFTMHAQQEQAKMQDVE